MSEISRQINVRINFFLIKLIIIPLSLGHRRQIHTLLGGSMIFPYGTKAWAPHDTSHSQTRPT
jgi:hypothetical protein